MLRWPNAPDPASRALYNAEWGAWFFGDTYLCHVHDQEMCQGRDCVIHNPSDHHMRDWPLHWRAARHMMERICPCGVGHPDPDDPTPDRIHGCCGCCAPPMTDEEFDLTFHPAPLLLGRPLWAN